MEINENINNIEDKPNKFLGFVSKNFFLLALVLLILLSTFIIFYNESDEKSSILKEGSENSENNNLPDNDTSSLGTSGVSGGRERGVETFSGEAGQASSGESLGGDDDNSTRLPDDLETSVCGFYYREYGVCTGVCPGGGNCVNEGRSCYCKNT